MVLNFRKNLSNFDRMIRVAIGLYMLWLIYTGVIAGWLAVVAFSFGISQFIEAALAY